MRTGELDVPIYITADQMKKITARDVNLIIYSLSFFQSRPTMFLTAARASQGINLLVLDQFPHEESIFCKRCVSHLLFVNNDLRLYMLFSSLHHLTLNNVLSCVSLPPYCMPYTSFASLTFAIWGMPYSFPVLPASLTGPAPGPVIDCHLWHRLPRETACFFLASCGKWASLLPFLLILLLPLSSFPLTHVHTHLQLPLFSFSL